MNALLLQLILSLITGGATIQSRQPYLPDSALTPGAALSITTNVLCSPDFRSPDRNVPVDLKRQVFDRYGLTGASIGYNVDHLIPVSLGGSNSIKNLWPQPLSGEWTHQMKNELERRLYRMVCNGELDLKQAQQELAADWVAAYKKYMTDR